MVYGGKKHTYNQIYNKQKRVIQCIKAILLVIMKKNSNTNSLLLSRNFYLSWSVTPIIYKMNSIFIFSINLYINEQISNLKTQV